MAQQPFPSVFLFISFILWQQFGQLVKANHILIYPAQIRPFKSHISASNMAFHHLTH